MRQEIMAELRQIVSEMLKEFAEGSPVNDFLLSRAIPDMENLLMEYLEERLDRIMEGEDLSEEDLEQVLADELDKYYSSTHLFWEITNAGLLDDLYDLVRDNYGEEELTSMLKESKALTSFINSVSLAGLHTVINDFSSSFLSTLQRRWQERSLQRIVESMPAPPTPFSKKPYRS